MIVNRQLKIYTAVLITFSIALVLSCLPMPSWVSYARPQWVFVVLLFWLIYTPQKVGPLSAFILGFIVDLLMGNVLGEHALIFVLFTYFIQKCLRYIQGMPLWQQMLGLGVCTLVNLGLQYGFLRMMGIHEIGGHLLLPAVSNMVIWPWLYFLCKDVNPRDSYQLMHRHYHS